MASASTADFLYPPKAAPDFAPPPGSSIKVSIIDCTATITAPVAHFMNPRIPGHEFLSAPAYSFLIEHSSGRKVLFDLGCRKDWENFSPAVRKLISAPGWKLDIAKNAAEVLQENGVDVAGGAIEAIIWSHWHFDHTGDPSTFPGSTDLVVGPGMVESLFPGYPTNPNSPMLESDFEGRTTRTIDFEAKPFKIGPLPAFDFFGDGSFYLLDTPGHAVGHMCGLARTTSKSEGHAEDTFIYMGGDTAHHGSEFRPSEWLPLPKEISPTPLKAYKGFCPGHIFEAFHPEGKGDRPFYKINDVAADDMALAQRSCDYMQEFDALGNVFVIVAHDETLLGEEVGMGWFPKATLNDWKQKSLADKGRWRFLKDFETTVSIKAKHNM